METLTTMISGSSAVVDRFSELEHRLDDHINQEAEQEAAQEAAGRELRALVNRHSEERRKKIEEARARWRRNEKRAAARIMKAVLREAQRDDFLYRTIGSVGIAAILIIFCVTGGLSLWLTIAGVILSTLFCAGNCVAYFTRNLKKKKGE